MNINELGMTPKTLQHRLYMSALLSLGDPMWGTRNRNPASCGPGAERFATESDAKELLELLRQLALSQLRENWRAPTD